MRTIKDNPIAWLVLILIVFMCSTVFMFSAVVAVNVSARDITPTPTTLHTEHYNNIINASAVMVDLANNNASSNNGAMALLTIITSYEQLDNTTLQTNVTPCYNAAKGIMAGGITEVEAIGYYRTFITCSELELK